MYNLLSREVDEEFHL